MNKSEIAERAAREIRRHFDEDFDTTIPGEVFDRDLVLIVEGTIAESQPPSIFMPTRDQFCAIWPEHEKGWTNRAMQAYEKLFGR